MRLDVQSAKNLGKCEARCSYERADQDRTTERLRCRLAEETMADQTDARRMGCWFRRRWRRSGTIGRARGSKRDRGPYKNVMCRNAWTAMKRGRSGAAKAERQAAPTSVEGPRLTDSDQSDRWKKRRVSRIGRRWRRSNIPTTRKQQIYLLTVLKSAYGNIRRQAFSTNRC